MVRGQGSFFYGLALFRGVRVCKSRHQPALSSSSNYSASVCNYISASIRIGSSLSLEKALHQPTTMTVVANKFTPEVLLSAPRRSSAVPNPSGSLALFTVSTYSFETHSKTFDIRVLDIATGQSKLLISDLNASEPTWLGEDNLVLWLSAGEKGETNLLLADAENLHNKYVCFTIVLNSMASRSSQNREGYLVLASRPAFKLLGLANYNISFYLAAFDTVSHELNLSILSVLTASCSQVLTEIPVQSCKLHC